MVLNRKTPYNGQYDQADGVRPLGRDYTYVNGRRVGGRNYNANTNTFQNRISMPKMERRIYNQGLKGYNKMLGQVDNAMAVTPEERQRFVDELYNPNAAKLKDEYRSTLGDAMGAANSAGVMNSIGFENYRANQLDKNLMQGLSDLYSQANLQAYELPNLKLAPIANAMSLYDASAEGPFNRTMRMFEPSFQGFTTGNNLGMQRYSLLPNSNMQQGGFFSSLF